MSGICSAHQDHDPDCRLCCAMTPADQMEEIRKWIETGDWWQGKPVRVAVAEVLDARPDPVKLLLWVDGEFGLGYMEPIDVTIGDGRVVQGRTGRKATEADCLEILEQFREETKG